MSVYRKQGFDHVIIEIETLKCHTGDRVSVHQRLECGHAYRNDRNALYMYYTTRINKYALYDTNNKEVVRYL